MSPGLFHSANEYSLGVLATPEQHLTRRGHFQMGGVQWTTSYHGPRVIYDRCGNLPERLGAGDGPDADDGVAVGAQPVLVPDGRRRLGHTMQVLDADAEARVPSDIVAVSAPPPELGGALGIMARVGGDERDPGRPCA